MKNAGSDIYHLFFKNVLTKFRLANHFLSPMARKGQHVDRPTMADHHGYHNKRQTVAGSLGTLPGVNGSGERDRHIQALAEPSVPLAVFSLAACHCYNPTVLVAVSTGYNSRGVHRYCR